MISITSQRHNFRRCGMPHPKEAVEYPDDRFTGAELEILKAEPMLTVAHEEYKSIALPADLIESAREAIDAGKTTKDGKPEVKAIEEILGRNITADERDEAWDELMKSEE